MTVALLLSALLSLAVGWGLAGWLSRGLGAWGWIDRPNQRSAHQRPTPRGGGAAFIASSLLGLLLLWALAPDTVGLAAVATVLLVPLPLALVGLVDDRRGLPVGLRLAVQLATALALALAAGCSWPLALVAMVLATAVINATNFMDGLDGLVASCLAIWLVLAAVLLQLPALLLLAVSLLAFLLWNWCPARLFMGDVGSTYLGAVLAGVLLRASVQKPPGLPGVLLLVAMPLMADSLSCLLRRLWAGQRLWQAHRLHLYQRLHQAGWSHRQVATLYATTTAVLAAATSLVRVGDPALLWSFLAVAASFTLLLGVWLDRRWAVRFEPSPPH